MVSEKQLIANRNNCLKSTGPRSIEGKSLASQNAFKHGFRSSQVLVRGQDNAEFARFRQDIADQLSPVGFVESRLADQIAVALWKLQRLDGLEPELLAVLQNRYLDQQAEVEQKAVADEKGTQEAQLAKQPKVGFDPALKLWMDTPEGQIYREGRWPTGPGCRSYITSFNLFWAELNCQTRETPDTAAVSVLPVEPPRTDLAYQVMMESQAAAEAAAQAGCPQPASASQSGPSCEDAPSLQDLESSWQSCLAPALVGDFEGSNVLLKFGRYHTQAQRSFYRALNELNKIQSLRRRNQAIGSQDLSSSFVDNAQNRSRNENQMAGDASN